MNNNTKHRFKVSTKKERVASAMLGVRSGSKLAKVARKGGGGMSMAEQRRILNWH